MSNKTRTRAGVAAPAALLTLAALMPLAPGGLSAQQAANTPKANNGNTRPSRPAVLVKPGNSNKTVQPPPTAGENGSTVKKSNRVGEVEKTTHTKLTHRYVITEIDTKNRLVARVRVENRGDVRSPGGVLQIDLGFITVAPTAVIKVVRLSMQGWSECPPALWVKGNRVCARADLPAIDPGKAVWVEEKFPPLVKVYLDELDLHWGKYISSIEGVDPTKIRLGFQATVLDGPQAKPKGEPVSLTAALDGGFWMTK